MKTYRQYNPIVKRDFHWWGCEKNIVYKDLKNLGFKQNCSYLLGLIPMNSTEHYQPGWRILSNLLNLYTMKENRFLKEKEIVDLTFHKKYALLTGCITFITNLTGITAVVASIAIPIISHAYITLPLFVIGGFAINRIFQKISNLSAISNAKANDRVSVAYKKYVKYSKAEAWRKVIERQSVRCIPIIGHILNVTMPPGFGKRIIIPTGFGKTIVRNG